MGLSLDVDLPLRPITLRHPRKQAIFRVQGAIADGFAQYMQSQGFTHIHTPKIVVAGAEGRRKTCSSWITLALRLIWHSPAVPQAVPRRCIRPCIRDRLGLPCRASQYLPSSEREYMGLDFEMAYIDSMYDVWQWRPVCWKSVMATLRSTALRELTMLNAEVPEIKEIPTIRFPRGQADHGGEVRSQVQEPLRPQPGRRSAAVPVGKGGARL